MLCAKNYVQLLTKYTNHFQHLIHTEKQSVVDSSQLWFISSKFSLWAKNTVQVKYIYAEKVLASFHFTASKLQQIKCICTGAAPQPPLAEMQPCSEAVSWGISRRREVRDRVGGWVGVINSLKISLLRQLTATTVTWVKWGHRLQTYTQWVSQSELNQDAHRMSNC